MLRIEDTDAARNSQEAIDVILGGLRWLGLEWDEGPVTPDVKSPGMGECGPYFQSQRGENYKRRVADLIRAGKAYEKDGAVFFRMKPEPVIIQDLVVGEVKRELTDREAVDPDFVIVRSDGQPVFHLVNVVDDLEVPGIGTFKATMINSGIPTIFVNAADIGYTGTELQKDINSDAEALARFETMRAYGAVKMGLIADISEAAARQHTPKIAFVAPATEYVSSSGKTVAASEIDCCVRALSMGKLHHAMMGTASVAIATAAAVPGTLVNLAAGGGEREAVTFGHPSGTLRVGAAAALVDGEWTATKAVMSRSARVLMEGFVRVPGDIF